MQKVHLKSAAIVMAVLLSFASESCSVRRVATGDHSSTDLHGTRTAAQASRTFNVMAPLVFSNDSDFVRFKNDIEKAKSLGAFAVSTDVWWGITEKEDNEFDWSLYDRLASLIRDAGLKWVPILSFHQCGGNVGDECDIPLPAWIEDKSSYGAKSMDHDLTDLLYTSEQGNRSRETISAWGTPYVIDQYREYFVAFQNHFSRYANTISEINVSLGPAGEMRFPSYNAHDRGSGYPSRGALQSYSPLAKDEFRKSMLNKYGSLEAIGKAWGSAISRLEDVSPPTDGDRFYAPKAVASTYGKDFLSWYSDSLISHGRMILLEASGVFYQAGSAFSSVELGAKLPGIHWRMTDGHSAEMSAGLLRSVPMVTNSFAPREPPDYRPVLTMFKEIDTEIRKRSGGSARFVLHFTCLEKSNNEDSSSGAGSRAMDLVFWVASQAAELGLAIKGENALAGPLASDQAWDNMANALEFSTYEGITFLRVADIAHNDLASRRFANVVERYSRK